MNELEEIQKWYFSQCNGDWEHGLGVKVETLDNPGWSVDIDLKDTQLEGRYFQQTGYGTGSDGETSGDEWLHCSVEDCQFRGRGGPFKLIEILRTFLEWANQQEAEQIGRGNE